MPETNDLVLRYRVDVPDCLVHVERVVDVFPALVHALAEAGLPGVAVILSPGILLCRKSSTSLTTSLSALIRTGILSLSTAGKKQKRQERSRPLSGHTQLSPETKETAQTLSFTPAQ